MSRIRIIAALLIAALALVALATPTKAGAIVKRSSLGSSQGIAVTQLTYASGALLVKARLYVPQKGLRPLPVVIFNHDGNDGISTSHHKCCLRLAAQGYAVVAPSYRGEDGSQGQVEVAKGEVNDVLSTWDWIKASPELDSQRVVLMGASHGALISLLAAGRQPNLRGVIFAYGVADIYKWWNYLKTHNKLGKDKLTRQTYGDGPQARPESFAIRNGLGALPRVKAPVLILQGGLDDITPPEQGRALYSACQRQGIPCEYCEYPNALHGFLVYAPYLTHDVTAAEKREAEQAWQKVFRFLESVF